MASDIEAEILRANILDQLNRLFDQLEDLDELREEMTEEEFLEEHEDTKKQLEEFSIFLETFNSSSSMTLSTELSEVQRALRTMNAGGNKNATAKFERNAGRDNDNAATASKLAVRTTMLQSTDDNVTAQDILVAATSAVKQAKGQ